MKITIKKMDEISEEQKEAFREIAREIDAPVSVEQFREDVKDCQEMVISEQMVVELAEHGITMDEFIATVLKAAGKIQ